MDKNKPVYKDPKALERMYWFKGMSQKQIADKLGCSSTTISKYMNKFNIKTRDPSIYINGGEEALKKEVENYIDKHKKLNNIEDIVVGEEKPVEEIVKEIKEHDSKSKEKKEPEKNYKLDRPEILTEYEMEHDKLNYGGYYVYVILAIIIIIGLIIGLS